MAIQQWTVSRREEFPSNGHGTVVFNIERATPFSLQIKPKPQLAAAEQQNCLRLEVHGDAVFLKLCSGSVAIKTLAEAYSSPLVSVGLEPGKVTSYWLSYDCHNMVVKYGKGYRMADTVLMEYRFLEGLQTAPSEQMKEKGRWDQLFNHRTARVIELLHTIEDIHIDRETFERKRSNEERQGFEDDGGGEILLKSHKKFKEDQWLEEDQQIEQSSRTSNDIVPTSFCGFSEPTISPVEFHSQPVAKNWPPLVLDSSKTTLFTLDSDQYMLSSSLPSTCRELYDNISGDGICLDTPSSPHERYKLSDAIRHSLCTHTGILYKKLREKTSCSAESVREGYLRVTLGTSHGNSPGVPYVLEIWPSNYGSPIHSHGNSYAVIKVLHGGLTVFIYNKGSERTHVDKEHSLLNFDVKKGDITWISPNWYQTHRLWNGTEDFCATIQCYNYGLEDNVRCPHFNYISGDGMMGEFLPNSDFTFMEMRDNVMKEYENFINTLQTNKD